MKFPYEEPVATNEGERGDHDYVNDPQGEAYREVIDEEALAMRDDDDYYVNDNLFPEEYRNRNANSDQGEQGRS